MGRVSLHSGKPGKPVKQLTNFAVMENSWKMRQKVKYPGKPCVVLKNHFSVLLFSFTWEWTTRLSIRASQNGWHCHQKWLSYVEDHINIQMVVYSREYFEYTTLDYGLAALSLDLVAHAGRMTLQLTLVAETSNNVVTLSFKCKCYSLLVGNCSSLN